jgi:hypothetical protein
MGPDHGRGVPQSTTFARVLDELKREGANLLVVGETSPRAHAAATAKLMGGSSETRRRVFVFTRDPEIAADMPVSPPETTRVVAQRSGQDDDAVEFPPAVERTVVDAQMLSRLATAVIDTIDEVEADAGGLEPAELRLCFDSITSLFRDHQSENVFRLLHLVTSRVRQAAGLGHFHLRLDRDSDHVHLLELMFDAVVEMRAADGDPQQRWDLRDEGITSDWMSV